MKKMTRLIGIATVGALALTGCASGSESADGGDKVVTVAYQKTSSFHQLDDLLKEIKPVFEAANKGVTIKLQPIEAEQDQYFTKLALMNGNDRTGCHLRRHLPGDVGCRGRISNADG